MAELGRERDRVCAQVHLLFLLLKAEMRDEVKERISFPF